MRVAKIKPRAIAVARRPLAKQFVMVRVLMVFLSVPVAALLVWLALGGQESRADFVVATDTLRTIDPHRVSWLDEIQAANALFEGLVRTHPETQQPEPAIARAWERSNDGLRYTFTLRREAQWSDGTPVVAEDFRRGWLSVLDPRLAAQYASLLFVIDGGEAYYRSRLNSDPEDDLPMQSVGVRVQSADQLVVELHSPCPYLLDVLAFPTCAPRHPSRSLRNVVDGLDWTDPQAVVTNGAYQLDRWDFKRRLRLVRNPHYWDDLRTNVATIELLITANPTSALLAYKTGRVDLMSGVATEVARELAEAQAAGNRHDFHLSDRFATFFLRVNCARPPFDRPALRRALALAIDRGPLCEHVLRLGETPAFTFVPPAARELMLRRTNAGATIGYDPPRGLGAGLTRAARIARARAELRSAGYLTPEDVPEVEIAIAPDPPRQRKIAEALQAMWHEALGVRSVIRVQERNVLSARIRKLDYDLARSDWYGDYLDPMTFLEMFTTGNNQNRTGWSHAEYDALLRDARRTADPRERYDLLARAERILCAEQLPIIPIHFKRGNFLLRPEFGGVRDNIRDILPIHRVRRAVRP